MSSGLLFSTKACTTTHIPFSVTVIFADQHLLSSLFLPNLTNHPLLCFCLYLCLVPPRALACYFVAFMACTLYPPLIPSLWTNLKLNTSSSSPPKVIFFFVLNFHNIQYLYHLLNLCKLELYF